MRKFGFIVISLLMYLRVYVQLFGANSAAMDYIGKGLNLLKTQPYLAGQELKKAIDSAPQWDYPYILLADLYQKNSLFTEAIHHYEKAVKIGLSQKGLEFQVFSDLGLLYLKTGDFKKAAEMLKQASKKKPGKLNELLTDLDVMIRAQEMITNNPGQAAEVLAKLIERHSDWLYLYAMQADALAGMGDTGGAMKVLKNALQFNPLRNIALSDETAAQSKAAFYFVRSPQNNGAWSLTMTLPKGNYSYKFYINYGLSGEKAILDPNNPQTVEKAPGLIINTFTVNHEWDKKTFAYSTFPTDPLFIRFEQKITEIRLAALTNLYPVPGKYFVNPAVTAKYTTNISFTYYNPNAYAVWAVGTFNQWGKEKNAAGIEEISPKYYWPLQEPNADGVWTLTTTADLNVHDYAFLVDEDHYEKDPIINQGAFKKFTNTQQILSYPKSVIGFDDLYLVDFTFFRKNATTVWIVGDFNYWGGTALTVKKILPGYYIDMQDPDHDGEWTAQVYLTKGKHLFKFVVNGTSWIVDPKQKTDSQNLSSANNLIIVGMESNKQVIKETNKVTVDTDGKEEVEFVYHNPAAQSVWLVGDFNFWGGKTTDMLALSPDYYYVMDGPDQNGDWKTKTKLPVGAYYYKYVVNGKNLLTDKDKPLVKVKLGAAVVYNNVVYIGMEKFPSGVYYGTDKDFGIPTVFKYVSDAPDVTNVWVIGDFNIWGGKYLFKDFIDGYYYPMKKSGVSGEWSVTVKLLAGHYQYRFVLNGVKEITDKNAAVTEKDSYNKSASVIEVGKN
jgi:tetratricopeptide (TPR) repeat protein